MGSRYVSQHGQRARITSQTYSSHELVSTAALLIESSRHETGWTPKMINQCGEMARNEGVFDDERISGQARNGKLLAMSFYHNHSVLMTVSFLP